MQLWYFKWEKNILAYFRMVKYWGSCARSGSPESGKNVVFYCIDQEYPAGFERESRDKRRLKEIITGKEVTDKNIYLFIRNIFVFLLQTF